MTPEFETGRGKSTAEKSTVWLQGGELRSRAEFNTWKWGRRCHFRKREWIKTSLVILQYMQKISGVQGEITKAKFCKVSGTEETEKV